jgi:hypothetical protein
MDTVQKHIYSNYHTPSSETYRILFLCKANWKHSKAFTEMRNVIQGKHVFRYYTRLLLDWCYRHRNIIRTLLCRIIWHDYTKAE